VRKVYDSGTVFDVEVLDMNESELTGKFLAGAVILAAVSLGLGVPTKASIGPLGERCVQDHPRHLAQTDYKIARVASSKSTSRTLERSRRLARRAVLRLQVERLQARRGGF